MIKQIRHKFQAFLRCQSGATALEYLLLAAIIAVAIIGVIGALGNYNAQTLNTAADSISGVSP